MAEGEAKEAEDRTEAPTQRRLERARQEGQVPLSREAVAFATLLAATLAGFLALPPLGMEWLRALRGLAEAPEGGDEAVFALLRAAALAVLPVLGAVALAGILASLGQTGPLLRAEAVLPDPSRLSPRAALRRMLGAEALLDLLRTLLKLGVVGAVLWLSVDLAALQAALHQPPGALPALIGRGALQMLVVALGAFGAIAALDLLVVRLRHLRQMRMSREELREELREAEGDPQVKARLRRLREGRARRRMLASIPNATVVITNPTHFAVALAYQRGGAAAPRLVAKGVDAMAARIRAAAEEHGVPIVANPPLARALYRLELETEIPQEHWQAVAEIIAYVWRLQGRAAHG
ncbi:EscU/YscU/HrcU family type III secretion system export apparatus switch protein [Paracraurococcus lichenis]|uniref:EscU/YscU/HrcU family type III secretion system export apparatus switch protein n=1 Tax=Paracraurococcus lichenis TaxID=3064888 RepID=A0ABT9DZL6_9PROT|nr:EscU/YscU/HrcU family type III secretion system export apparatus switch protein [Paracraurococcus sp. LOR1-02]MDO9709341.1 EscU/YscU/HrcU family type III secretion system export apparatus switch protein [Paracraurococcus sp. LOR1-02]